MCVHVRIISLTFWFEKTQYLTLPFPFYFHYSIHVYEEAHSKFLAPWSTMVAFKDMQTRNNWYRNAAEIELQLQKRILSRKSGSSSLRNFDGATMSSYQLPSKSFEIVHCRQENVPADSALTLSQA